MNGQGDAPRLLLTAEATAAALGISRAFVWRLIQRGEIRTVRIGKSRRIPVAAVEEFAAKLEAEARG